MTEPLPAESQALLSTASALYLIHKPFPFPSLCQVSKFTVMPVTKTVSRPLWQFISFIGINVSSPDSQWGKGMAEQTAEVCAGQTVKILHDTMGQEAARVRWTHAWGREEGTPVQKERLPISREEVRLLLWNYGWAGLVLLVLKDTWWFTGTQGKPCNPVLVSASAMPLKAHAFAARLFWFLGCCRKPTAKESKIRCIQAACELSGTSSPPLWWKTSC